MRRIRTFSPIRQALQTVWDLNIKAMPTALIWSISFWFVIETHSLLTRIIAISVANLTVITSGILIVKKARPSQISLWKSGLLDSFSWMSLTGTGLILSLALENLSRVHDSNRIEKLFYLSIFVSSLLLWLIVSVVIVPFRIQIQLSEDRLKVVGRAVDYLRFGKRYLLVSLSILLFGWPFFFIYAFLALTFAQCMTLSSSEEVVDAAVSSLDMRVHIAKK